ncbi:hypothetical protein ACJX0J_029331, partial [Zea mays]
YVNITHISIYMTGTCHVRTLLISQINNYKVSEMEKRGELFISAFVFSFLIILEKSEFAIGQQAS